MSVNKYISTVLVWLMCTSPLVVKPAKLGKRVKALEDKVDKLSTKVAFTAAALSKAEYQSKETVKFDVVIYNEGGHYDKAISMFTCPVNGTYFFYTNMLAYIDGYMHGVIEVSGERLSVLAHANGDKAEIWNSGSNVVFTKCAQKQTVRVIAMFNGNTLAGRNYYGGIMGFPSTFSGVLVSADV